jgi:hypothetical protein
MNLKNVVRLIAGGAICTVAAVAVVSLTKNPVPTIILLFVGLGFVVAAAVICAVVIAKDLIAWFRKAPRPKDFGALLKNVPEGDWAVISLDGKRVLAYGPCLEEVLEIAPHGIIIRKFSGTILL